MHPAQRLQAVSPDDDADATPSPDDSPRSLAGTVRLPTLANQDLSHLFLHSPLVQEGSDRDSPRWTPALYVANLHPRVTEYMLQEIFAVAGPVLRAKIDSDVDRSSGLNSGRVEYEDMRSAETAVKVLNGRKIFDTKIDVDWAEPEDHDQAEEEALLPNDWTDAALHVGNLSPRVTEYMLREIFAAVGAIRQTQIIHTPGDGFNLNHAIVDYEDERNAWIALQTLNGRPIFDTRIWVKLAAPAARLDAMAQHHYVLVDNISTDVNDDVLKDAFRDFQSLSDAHVAWDRNPNRPGGEGVLAFSNRSDAEQAIVTMNGTQLGSSAMVVSWAQKGTEPATRGSVPTILAPDHSITLRPPEAAYLQSDRLASNLRVAVQDNVASVPRISVGPLVDTLHKRLFSIEPGSPGETQRKLLINLLVRLCHGCQRLPSTVTVSGVRLLSQHHVAGGGYADIYHGQRGNIQVALKRFRAFSSEDRDLIRERFCREVIVWYALNHPNVMPFLGLDDQTFHPSLCMVSPWMRNGNMLQYAMKEELSPHRLNHLLVQAADGLDYLHEQSVIHGDLRCGNILVNDRGEACLTDFGLATLVSDSSMATATSSQGSHRWNAPEVYAETFTHRTKATDLYAFGCVCLELHTRKHPFPHIVQDVTVMASILRGGKPSTPSEYDSPGAQIMWTTIQKCWDADPNQRPPLHHVRGALFSCV